MILFSIACAFGIQAFIRRMGCVCIVYIYRYTCLDTQLWDAYDTARIYRYTRFNTQLWDVYHCVYMSAREHYLYETMQLWDAYRSIYFLCQCDCLFGIHAIVCFLHNILCISGEADAYSAYMGYLQLVSCFLYIYAWRSCGIGWLSRCLTNDSMRHMVYRRVSNLFDYSLHVLVSYCQKQIHRYQRYSLYFRDVYLLSRYFSDVYLLSRYFVYTLY